MRILRNLGLASLLGLSLVGCENKDASQTSQIENEKKLNFYVSTNENSYFSPEAFSLAEEFLEENLSGVDIKFNYVSREELDNVVLNHTDSFAIVEKSGEDMAKRLIEKIEQKASFSPLMLELEDLLKKSEEIGDTESAELCRKSVEELKSVDRGIEKSANDFYIFSTGEADVERSVAYLVRSEAVGLAGSAYALAENAVDMQGLLCESLEASLNLPFSASGKKALEEQLSSSKKTLEQSEAEKADLYAFIVKSAAKTIVHETGHLFGLCHPHQYSNDSLEDFTIEGRPNVMSYQEVADGKYGFAFDKKQIEQIQDYLNKGRTFLEMQEQGFNLQNYFNRKALENSWVQENNR